MECVRPALQNGSSRQSQARAVGGGGPVARTQFPSREYSIRLEIQYSGQAMVREMVPSGSELEPRRMMESAALRV